jgi:hypothetical protein
MIKKIEKSLGPVITGDAPLPAELKPGTVYSRLTDYKQYRVSSDAPRSHHYADQVIG